jgi:hypothetical protein
MTVRVKSSAGENTFTVIVKGDPSGDGKINALDMLYIQQNILNIKQLDSVYLKAADLSGDGKVNALDLLQAQQRILGLI